MAIRFSTLLFVASSSWFCANTHGCALCHDMQIRSVRVIVRVCFH
jgi:hypothetical protein